MQYNNIKTSFAQSLDLPKAVVLDLPSISIIGNQEITIENFKSIKEFSEKSITINTLNGKIIICGNKIKISYLTKETIIINGSFNFLEFG